MARIAAIEVSLPSRASHWRDLVAEFPDFPVEKIAKKLGIDQVHIAAEGECASDLAVQAAEKLFVAHPDEREQVDYVVLLTQTPDYLLPTTACLLQSRLKLSRGIGAIDVNLGCSGYVYGLGLAEGLIASGQARKVLLLTADTYSRIVHRLDRPMRLLLGDAATASLVTAEGQPSGPFVFGTDGEHSMNIVVPAGGMRCRRPKGDVETDERGNSRTDADVHMDGRAMFGFSSEVVPEAVDGVLRKAQLRADEIDLFVFHQANLHMLNHLREKLDIGEDKFPVDLRDCGSTGSSSIPIVLSRAAASGRLRRDMRLLLVGYGVGLSWGACVMRW